jgi:hypothetical protein
MVFQPGQSGNLAGNKGYSTRRKGNAEIFHEIKNRGYLDPLIRLAQISHESENEGIRASAAASLAPYTHPKLQSVPVPRYITTPFDVPEFQTIQDASSFLAKIPVLVARGELDMDFGKELADMAHKWIDAKRSTELEERLVLIEEAVGIRASTSIPTVVGGLPTLPGCENLIMPGDANGRDAASDDNPPQEPQS